MYDTKTLRTESLALINVATDIYIVTLSICHSEPIPTARQGLSAGCFRQVEQLHHHVCIARVLFVPEPGSSHRAVCCVTVLTEEPVQITRHTKRAPVLWS